MLRIENLEIGDFVTDGDDNNAEVKEADGFLYYANIEKEYIGSAPVSLVCDFYKEHLNDDIDLEVEVQDLVSEAN